MLPRLLRPLLPLSIALLAAAPARAGDLSLGVVLGGRHGAVELSYGGGSKGHRYHGGRGPVVAGCALHGRCTPARIFVPGHYASVEREVWVPACREKVWVDPVYATRHDACGRPVRVLVCEGRWSVRVVPGHYETRCERVWVPAGYEARCATY
jgi:hypothetical protein